jgi:hypothetical protein
MLHYETVTPYLRNTLMRLMADATFDSFRLVGGTSLSVTEMLDLYEKRYPYNYSREDILRGFTNFDKADAEPDPMCLFHKDWDVIKRDLTETFLG